MKWLIRERKNKGDILFWVGVEGGGYELRCRNNSLQMDGNLHEMSDKT